MVDGTGYRIHVTGEFSEETISHRFDEAPLCSTIEGSITLLRNNRTTESVPASPSLIILE